MSWSGVRASPQAYLFAHSLLEECPAAGGDRGSNPFVRAILPFRQAGKAQDSESCIRAFEPLNGNYEEICGVEQLVACWAHNPKVAAFESCPRY